MKLPNQAIKFAPYGSRTLVPRAVYGERYVYKDSTSEIVNGR